MMLRSRPILWALLLMAGCSSAPDDAVLPTIEPSTAPAPDMGAPHVDDGFVTGEEALELVNPMIGTGGLGFAFSGLTPAVQVPLGFMRVGPDTTRGGSHPEAYQHFGGYFVDDPHIRGFSHTHFVGTGTADYGNLRVAFADDSRMDRPPRRWWLTKGPEVAEPGYYRVELEEGVTAELTAAHHAAIHRYEVPREQWLAIDPTASVDDEHVAEGSVRYADGRLSGFIDYRGDYVGRRNPVPIWFEAHIEPAPTETRVWDGTAWVPGTETTGQETALAMRWASDAKVVLRLGISLISDDHAVRRYEETAPLSFETMRENNRAQWAEILDRVQIRGGTAKQQEIFYTALYNCFRMPSRLDEYGEYPGLDGAVHDTDHAYYSDLSLWDTYRTLHPLWTLIAPDETRDVLRSLVKMGTDGGYMPRWPAALSYTAGMEGEPAAMLIAEGATKGIEGVDYQLAYEILQRTADGPTPDGAPYGGRDGIEDYLELGYIPVDRRSTATSNTLEYAIADNALYELATFLGHEDDAMRYLGRSLQYENVWDPDTKFFRPRNADGTFAEPFSKTKFHERSGDFAEGSAWHYRFYAWHDAAHMIELFGGPDAFVAELDTFMSESKLFSGNKGLLLLPDAYYWHTNQPSLHAPFLFGPAGRWDLLEHWRDQILEFAYDTTPDGLVGNDDGGTLSSWYVLGATGLFPIVGTPRWWTFTPIFDDVRILGRTPAWYGEEPGERSHDELLAEAQ